MNWMQRIMAAYDFQPPADTDEYTYFHVTKDTNVPSILENGFSLTQVGKGIGLQRSGEAAGISLTNDPKLINVYMMPIEEAPLIYQDKIREMGSRKILHVKINPHLKILDMTKEQVSAREFLNMGWQDDPIIELIEAMSNTERTCSRLDKNYQQLAMDLADGKIQDFLFPAVIFPALLDKKLHITGTKPEEITRQLQALGYDGIRYDFDDLKIFDPRHIQIIGVL